MREILKLFYITTIFISCQNKTAPQNILEDHDQKKVSA